MLAACGAHGCNLQVLSEKQAVHRDTVHRLALAEQQKVELEDKVEELGRQLATAQDAKVRGGYG
jgi:hypothetical protein